MDAGQQGHRTGVKQILRAQFSRWKSRKNARFAVQAAMPTRRAIWAPAAHFQPVYASRR